MVTSKLKFFVPPEDPKPAEEATLEEPPARPTRQETPADSAELKKVRRKARVLVSDLLLYHKDKVEAGLAEKALYRVLQEEIDKSYKHFCEEVAGLVDQPQPFFRDAIIDLIGEGDERAIGHLPY
jgi:hypothetical protein